MHLLAMRYQVCLVDKFTFHGGQHRHHRAGQDVTDHPAEGPAVLSTGDELAAGSRPARRIPGDVR